MSKYARFLKRLIKEAKKEGFTPVMAYDGEEWHKEDLIENATASDIGYLRFEKGNDRLTFMLVYGNAYYETISDYGYNSDSVGEIGDKISTRVYDFFFKICDAYR